MFNNVLMRIFFSDEVGGGADCARCGSGAHGKALQRRHAGGRCGGSVGSARHGGTLQHGLGSDGGALQRELCRGNTCERQHMRGRRFRV